MNKSPDTQQEMMQANYKGRGKPTYTMEESESPADGQHGDKGEIAAPIYVANSRYGEYR